MIYTQSVPIQIIQNAISSNTQFHIDQFHADESIDDQEMCAYVQVNSTANALLNLSLYLLPALACTVPAMMFAPIAFLPIAFNLFVILSVLVGVILVYAEIITGYDEYLIKNGQFTLENGHLIINYS